MNVLFRRRPLGGEDPLDIIVCEPLAEQGVPHGFSLRWRRERGRHIFGGRDHGSRDRDALARGLGLDRGVAHMRQVHGDVVRLIGAPVTEPPVCDGLATDRQGLALIVQTADCVPLLFWDEHENVVAAVHAGWRGALAQIPVRALTFLQEGFGSQAASVHVAMGPAIGACCYEVGDEVVRAFVERFAKSEEFFTPGARRKQHLDLIGASTRQLVEAGVPGNRIYSSGVCTSCDNGDFYSYRKEGKGVGRLMSAIGAR